MKAEQPEKTHLEELACVQTSISFRRRKEIDVCTYEESARSETQLRSQGPLLALPRLHVAHETNMADDRWNSYREIFPIILDDRSVGSIRLFPMIDYEISADSQHY